jgi:hypothetical protein
LPAAEATLGPWSGTVAACVSGLIAAWIAAGSAGLLGHPLRHGLVGAALGCLVIAAWPKPARRLSFLAALVTGAAVAIVMLASSLPVVNLLAAAVLLLAMAEGHSGLGKTTLRLSAEAVTVLGLYRVACSALPTVWLGADACGGLVGWLGGALVGRALWVGSTFAGLDFLAPMVYLAILAPLRLRTPALTVAKGDIPSVSAVQGGVDSSDQSAAETSAVHKPRLALFRKPGGQILAILGAIVLGHLVYLAILALAPDVLKLLGITQPKPVQTPMGPIAPPTSLGGILWDLIPWNLPALAIAIHGLIAWAALGWLTAGLRVASQPTSRQPAAGLAVAATAAVVIAAAVFPMLTVLSTHQPRLSGRKIVIFKEGFLNWMRPVHGEYGRLSIGMYGLLPDYLETFGAKPLVSPELSEEDLRDADALVLIYPNKPWQKGQLERIERFVRRGGRLLVLGEHTVHEKDGGARFNDVLKSTAMQVRFDSAMMTIGGWLQSYDALAHPTQTGVEDNQNEFGTVTGASVEAHWPARPLLVGRWGWADPGNVKAGESQMGNHFYDAGERLGDILLGAEQSVGEGQIILFGDTSAYTNGLMPGCHEYTSRLFAYVADRSNPPPAAWREWVGLALLASVFGMVVWRPSAGGLAAVVLALSGSLALATDITYRNWTLLPDGRLKSPNNLAYIDTSRPAMFSQESWRPDGLGGLGMTLLRNDFLVLNLQEISRERLERARVLISVAPARSYTAEEREIIRDFVAHGGIFISTVGYIDAGPSRELLSEFGFYVGVPPGVDPKQDEPYPLGYFKSPFFNGGNYVNYVRFHAAWPVYCTDRNAMAVSVYPGNLPVIVVRRYMNSGLVAVVGDTFFASNKNLENEGGEPFEGMRENALFWRWFLSWLRDGVGEGPIWYPTKPEREGAPGQPKPPDASPPPDSQSPAAAAALGLPRLPGLPAALPAAKEKPEAGDNQVEGQPPSPQPSAGGKESEAAKTKPAATDSKQ